jgi:RNA polymerase sigma factor (sigma-70 family)
VAVCRDRQPRARPLAQARSRGCRLPAPPGRSQDAVHDRDHATTLTVRDAVLALPDRLRVVVLLHYFADLPVATVARQVEKSEGTVKRDLFDARQRMAQILGETR